MKSTVNADFAGIVIQITDDITIEFISGRTQDLKIGGLVGVVDDDFNWILGEIVSLTPEYFLREFEKYFVGRAVKGELGEVLTDEHHNIVALKGRARVLGFYRYDSNRFSRLPGTANRYTCRPLQPVYLVGMENAKEIYGISEDGFRIGTICFPEKGIATLRPEQFFNKHTLITGVTGSGKTRLAALLISKLATFGGNVIVVDPHDEYEPIIPSEGLDYKLTKHSRKVSEDRVVENYGKTITYAPLQFALSQLSAPILIRLLPQITPQQGEFIHRAFEIAARRGKDLTFESLLAAIEQWYKETMVDQGPYQKQMLSKVYNAVLSRIKSACYGQKPSFFSERIPQWVKGEPRTISILAGGDLTDRFSGMFLTAVLQSVLIGRNSSHVHPKILLVDECHQLFKGGSQEDQMSGQLLEQLLREARKFGAGLVLVTQVEEDIPEHVRDQLQNRFRFRTIKSPDTATLADRICVASLFGSQASFIVQIDELLASEELEPPYINKTEDRYYSVIPKVVHGSAKGTGETR